MCSHNILLFKCVNLQCKIYTVPNVLFFLKKKESKMLLMLQLLYRNGTISISDVWKNVIQILNTFWHLQCNG